MQLEYVVPAETPPEATVGGLLRGRLGFSRGLIRRVLAAGELLRNGRPARLADPARPGDVMLVRLPERVPRVTPEPLPLEVAYEDRHVLVVNKPAGMVTHPVLQHRSGTLANALAYYLVRAGEDGVVRVLTRLDRATSGAVLVAKHALAQQRLERQRRAGQLRREYLALLHGVVARDSGVIDAPVALAAGSIIERRVAPDGQPARTRYRVLQRRSQCTLVLAELETGRTHQLRVHCASIGHPIVGDTLYGPLSTSASRLLLHAWRLHFLHVESGEPVTVEVPPPTELAPACDRPDTQDE
jgi:23S rRNA pseudouridine1911/1915/1917 synthase